MSHARPDTNDRGEPGGTPSPGPDNLIDKPITPGSNDGGTASAVPGVYGADQVEREHGEAAGAGH